LLLKKDYLKIVKGRKYFGDFDLLFGAAKQNLRIAKVPIKIMKEFLSISC
jgi:hypothetical protein